MREHSVLAIMLVVALVISIGSTVVTVSQLEVLSFGSGQQIVAAATASGNNEINITEDITITLVNDTIDFGSGKVDTSASFAVVYSNGDTTDGTWANSSGNITVRNDGNVGINLTVNFDKNAGSNTTSFICQDDSSCGDGFTDADIVDGGALSFAYFFENVEPGACDGTNIEAGGVSWQMINDSGYDYPSCGCLNSNLDNDTIAFYIQAGIPPDAVGNKSSKVTFTSTKAGGSNC